MKHLVAETRLAVYNTASNFASENEAQLQLVHIIFPL